jgi:hypothetical protein
MAARRRNFGEGFWQACDTIFRVLKGEKRRISWGSYRDGNLGHGGNGFGEIFVGIASGSSRVPPCLLGEVGDDMRGMSVRKRKRKKKKGKGEGARVRLLRGSIWAELGHSVQRGCD